MNTFGLIPAILPSAEVLAKRRRPTGFKARRSDTLDAYQCFRGVVCSGSNGTVLIGLGKASEPLDEALAVCIDFACLSVEAATVLLQQMERAIDAAGSASTDPPPGQKSG